MSAADEVTPSLAVVLDTNVLVEDFFLARPHAELLLREGLKERLRLVVPAVVLAETVNIFEERAAEERKKLDGALRNLARMRVEIELVENPTTAAKFYELVLHFRLNEGGAVIAPYPQVAHEEITRRAIHRRKPFKSDGKGYRDTLIWYTVLEQARQCPTVLVTRNTSDFADPADPTRLHRDLLEDIVRSELSPDSVQLRNGVQDAVDALVPRASKVELELTDRLRVDSKFAEKLGHDLASLFTTDDAERFSVVSYGLDPSAMGYWFSDFRVESAHEIDGDLFAVELSARANITVSFHVDEDDMFGLGSETEILDVSDGMAFATTVHLVDLTLAGLYGYPNGQLNLVAVTNATPS